jgi:glycosyltransferase involved in cell wall biosynthesis
MSAYRICVITPGHLATNPRVVKEADALAEAGYDVSVITGDFAPWARSADQEFADRPWHVVSRLTFGPRAAKRARITQVVRQRLARFLIRMGFSRSQAQRASWHPIGPDLIAEARKVKADLYIAHYVAALPAAALAAKHHGAQYAFDAEDFHLGDLPDKPEHAFAKKLTQSVEEYWLPGCAYVSAASPGIAQAYAATYGIAEPTVLLNVFPLSHAPAKATPVGSILPRPSLYWFSQTIGPDRGLQCAIRAIAIAASRPHLYLRGTPAAGCEQQFMQMASEMGVADRLHFLPPAAPSAMEELAAKFDLGFSGETRHTRNKEVALGNKLFSYLLAGIPLVMSDTPAHRGLASELDGAARLYAIDDPQSLANAIDSLLREPAELCEARAKAFELGQRRFNWNCEQTKLLRLVKRLYPGFEHRPDAKSET